MKEMLTNCEAKEMCEEYGTTGEQVGEALAWSHDNVKMSWKTRKLLSDLIDVFRASDDFEEVNLSSELKKELDKLISSKDNYLMNLSITRVGRERRGLQKKALQLRLNWKLVKELLEEK